MVLATANDISSQQKQAADEVHVIDIPVAKRKVSQCYKIGGIKDQQIQKMMIWLSSGKYLQS